MLRVCRTAGTVLCAWAMVEAATPARAEPVPRAAQAETRHPSVVTHVGVDKSTSLVAVDVWLDVGSADDPAEYPGLAELMGELLRNVGSRHLSADDRAKVAKVMGVRPLDTSVFVGVDRTQISCLVPAEALELALYLESDRLGFFADGIDAPLVRQALASLEKGAARRAENATDVFFNRAVAAAYGTGHPYAHDLDLGALSGLPPEALRRWARAHYGGGSVRVSLAGNVEPQAARALVAKYFGGLPQSAPMARDARERASDPTLTVRADVKGGGLALHWKTPRHFHPDDSALDVFARVLGRRLQGRLVSGGGPATWVSARQMSRRLGSVFALQAVARPGREAEVAGLIEQELATARAGQFEATEVEVARDQMLMETALLREGLMTRARAESSALASTGKADYFGFFRASYSRVSKAELTRVVQRYLGKPALTARLVADASRPTARPSAGAAPSAPEAWKRALPLLSAASAPTPDEPFRYRPPRVGPPARFVPAEPDELRLKSGMRVLVLPQPGAEYVRFRVGVRWRQTPPVWELPLFVAELAADAKLEDGRTLEATLAALGTRTWSFASGDASELRVDVAPRHFEAALLAVLRGLRRGVFDPGHFTRLKQSIEERLGKQTARERATAWLDDSLVPKGHRYRRNVPDQTARLARLTLDEVVKHRERASGWSDLFVVVEGETEVARVRDLLEGAAAGAAAKERPVPAPVQMAKGVFLIDDPSEKDVEVVFVLPLERWGGPDFAANLGVRQLFGGVGGALPSLADRFGQAGLAQWNEGSSSIEGRADETSFRFKTHIAPGGLVALSKAISAQIAALPKARITAAALAELRRELVVWLREAHVDPVGRIRGLDTIATLHADAGMDGYLWRRVERLGEEDLIRAAERGWKPTELRIVAYGPVADQRDAMQAAGLGAVHYTESPRRAVK